MKTAIPISLIPALVALGMGVDTAIAQEVSGTSQPAPNATSLRSEPMNMDERELQQAVNEGQATSENPTQWAIAAAPSSAIATPAQGATAAQPLSTSDASSVPHFSGGVGSDERSRMEAVKSQFNLRMLFAVSGAGNYLSGVKVRIQDTRGAILLDTTSNGPWFYAQLPPGAYVLTLDNQGQIQQRNINIVPQRATIENVYWAGPVSPTSEGTKGSDWAIQPGMAPDGTAMTGPSLQPLRTSTGIPYLTGGSDPGERARLEAAASEYNLRLQFTAKNAGATPLSVKVSIQDSRSQRTLLETEATGPLFYTRLPPGEYLVTLNYAGQSTQRRMDVPGYGAASASFQWTH